jgi:hypothetical protein
MNKILARLAAGTAGIILPAVLAASAMASTCPAPCQHGHTPPATTWTRAQPSRHHHGHPCLPATTSPSHHRHVGEQAVRR